MKIRGKKSTLSLKQLNKLCILVFFFFFIITFQRSENQGRGSGDGDVHQWNLKMLSEKYKISPIILR